MSEFLPPIQKMLVNADAVLREALAVIDGNAQRICFVVDPLGVLVGTLSDGDIRRALLRGADLTAPVSQAMQRQFTALPASSPTEVIQEYLSSGRATHVPLLDQGGKPVDYACAHRSRRIQIAEPCLNGNELAYVSECIRTNWISSQGAYVQRFESMFAEYCGVPHALAVANGTVALHLALVALGVGPGDEVIVPDFTFAASINAILYAGATPVIVDISPDTWTMDPAAMERAITRRTKAVMPVHLYGYPCDMPAILAVAARHDLLVVEDCAESLGSTLGGRHTGSFGDVGTFSFFGNKTITTGEGGMLTFKDPGVARRAAMLRDHGMSRERRYWHDVVGFNYRMTNIQAAIGVAQMERIEEFVAAKRRLGAEYLNAFSSIKGITLPPVRSDVVNSYWLFTMLIGEDSAIPRDELIQKLLFNGIETRPVFYPLHVMPPYRQYAAGEGYPVTDRVSRLGLSLPSAVALSEAALQNVIRSFCELFDVRDFMRSGPESEPTPVRHG